MRNSRRARLVLTVLLLVAFSLITLDYRTGSLNGVRTGAGDVFGPIENGVDHVTHPVGSWFSSIGHLSSYKSQNAQLKTEIAKLQGKLNISQAQRVELAQDEKLLHLAGIAQFHVVPARVIAYGSSDGYEDTAVINRGTLNGLAAKDQTVVTGDGLVGRTISCSRSTCTILLADDPTFSVGIRTEGKALELGNASGAGVGNNMTMQMFNSDVLLSPGESVVSAGSTENNDSPFVPEVPVGRIVTVGPPGGLERSATLNPFVDFTAINVVGVVTKAPTSVKHDSLLPVKPTPAPTTTVQVRVTVDPSGSPIATTTATPHGTATSSSTASSTSTP